MGGQSQNAGRGKIDTRLAFQGDTMSRFKWSSCIVLVGFLLIWGLTLPSEQVVIETEVKAEAVLADDKKQDEKPVEKEPEPIAEVVETKPEVVEVHQPVLTDCERLELELRKYDWDSRVMYAIARAENSTCNPAKHNETSSETHRDGNGNVICVGSYGALQVGCLHYSPSEDRNDLATNVAVAYRLWSNRQIWGNGYEAWTMYLNGVYAQYL